jgi:diphthamide synthase (EF-2-diphthine--ammonia ligase)
VVRLAVVGSGVELGRTTKVHLLGEDGEIMTLLVDAAEAEATAALLRARSRRPR